MTSRDQMRVGDSDREQAAARLRHALDEGRLSLGELDERLQEVYAARTFGELDRLVADLPAITPPERAQVAETTDATPVPPSRHEPSPRLPGWLAMSWRLWVAAVTLNLVVWFIVSVTSTSLVYFWPMWVAGPWAALNVALMIVFPPRHR